MRFFNPEGTAIDELKGRIEVLKRDRAEALNTARSMRESARDADDDAEAIGRRIAEYRALLPNN